MKLIASGPLVIWCGRDSDQHLDRFLTKFCTQGAKFRSIRVKRVKPLQPSQNGGHFIYLKSCLERFIIFESQLHQTKVSKNYKALIFQFFNVCNNKMASNQRTVRHF